MFVRGDISILVPDLFRSVVAILTAPAVHLHSHPTTLLYSHPSHSHPLSSFYYSLLSANHTSLFSPHHSSQLVSLHYSTRQFSQLSSHQPSLFTLSPPPHSYTLIFFSTQIQCSYLHSFPKHQVRFNHTSFLLFLLHSTLC